MKLTKNPMFLHYYSKFMRILLFVLKYIVYFLPLKMINGIFWQAKIMASPFKNILNFYEIEPWWHNCCNCGKCGKKNQIWIPVTTVVAITAILKNPGDINCRNYGNFEDKKKYTDPFSSQLSQLWQFWRQKIYGSLFITIAAIMAILKRYSWLLMTAIVAIVAIVEKQRWIPVTTIVAIMAILKIAKIASLWQSSRLSCNSEI